MHSGRRTTYVVVKIATIPLLHHSTAVQPYLHEEFLPNLRRTDEESLRLSPRGQKPLFQPQQQIQKLHCRVVYCQSCFFKAQVFTFFFECISHRSFRVAVNDRSSWQDFRKCMLFTGTRRRPREVIQVSNGRCAAVQFLSHFYAGEMVR